MSGDVGLENGSAPGCRWSPPAGRLLEDRIAALATSQQGVVTRTQLLELGLSGAAVGRRLRSGRLRDLQRGVYLVGPLQSDRATELAAVLSGGPEALLSHTNALRLWNVYALEDPRPVHVTVPGSGRGRRPGIVFHRVVALAGDECAVVDGIPVTAPGRTIVDAAGLLGSREIEAAIAAAEREGLIGSEELAGLPDRYARRRGMALLRSLIAERTDARFTRSEAERRCLDLLRAGGLPRPHANVSVGPYELDLFWPQENVAIEIDGWKHHSSRPKFEGDRRKDGWLRARGIEVIRLTWRQIARDAIATAVQVGQTLAVARTRRLDAHAVGGRRDEGGCLDGPRG